MVLSSRVAVTRVARVLRSTPAAALLLLLAFAAEPLAAAVATRPGPAAPVAPPPGAHRADRVIAVVDEDPILESELDRVLALGFVTPGDGESPEALRRRVLDALVAERLRFHEVDRFGFSEVPPELVAEQYARVRAAYPSEEVFLATLRQVGMDPQGLRQLVARQLMVLTYVEERLGPRVFVSLDEIRRYYDEVLVPELAAKKQPPPPIEEVREDIRAVLKERRLNEEVERWTADLRAEADVQDFLATPRDGLPARVVPIESRAAPAQGTGSGAGGATAAPPPASSARP